MDDNVSGEDDNKEFGADFDAEVGVDEKENPEKYLQKLSGKIATSLRKYRDEKNDIDPELSKYIANTVISAAVPGLSEDDVKVIMDKVKEKSLEKDPNVGEENNNNMASTEPEINEPEQDNSEPKFNADPTLNFESKKRKLIFNDKKLKTIKEEIELDSIIDEIENNYIPKEKELSKKDKFSRPKFK